MRALIVDNIIKKLVAKKIKYAQENKINFQEMIAISEGKAKPIGERAMFPLFIPQGFRCVFSIEMQKDKCWYRHLSVSIDKKNKYPSTHAMQEILKLYEFDLEREDSTIMYIEEEYQAINALQKINVEE